MNRQMLILERLAKPLRIRQKYLKNKGLADLIKTAISKSKLSDCSDWVKSLGTTKLLNPNKEFIINFLKNLRY